MYQQSLIYLLGHYAFIESSAPRVPGDVARLQSTQFQASTQCLHFWYHMYGSGIGTLNVYVVTSSGNKTVWSLSGNQGNAWNSAQVAVTSNVQYNVSTCTNTVYIRVEQLCYTCTGMLFSKCCYYSRLH